MDFIAIGDTVVDEFINLKEAQVNCDINHGNCTISMKWGDKIPYDSSVLVAGVGNAANAAVAAARLGLKSGFISNVGKDRFGEEILAVFASEGVDTKYIAVNEGIPTNHHYVLCYDAERTILRRIHISFQKDLRRRSGSISPQSANIRKHSITKSRNGFANIRKQNSPSNPARSK
jgi:sugar/nucleoside kinase (ribokinase family)